MDSCGITGLARAYAEQQPARSAAVRVLRGEPMMRVVRPALGTGGARPRTPLHSYPGELHNNSSWLHKNCGSTDEEDPELCKALRSRDEIRSELEPTFSRTASRICGAQSGWSKGYNLPAANTFERIRNGVGGAAAARWRRGGGAVIDAFGLGW
jgi:hypothetical protein